MKIAGLPLFAAVLSSTLAASPVRGMAWKGAPDGLECLAFTLHGEERNLINPGKRLGHLKVKGTAADAPFTLDTAEDAGTVTEDTPARRARRYLAFPRRGRFEMRLVNNGIAKGKAVDAAKDLSRIAVPLERRSETGMQTVEFRSLPEGGWTVRTPDGGNVKFRACGGRTTVRFPFASSAVFERDR